VRVLVLCLLAGCGGTQDPGGGGDDPCADVELDVKRVWSAEIRAEVVGYGGQIGGMTREEVATRMDDVSRDWAMLRRSACRDHFVRHLISAEDLAAKNRCLDGTLQKQRTLVESLRSPSAELSPDAMQSLSQDLDGCR
jgi:hypothetical protein